MLQVQDPTRNLGGQVLIPLRDVTLEGELVLPPNAIGCVLFTHGTGSGHHGPQDGYVARSIQAAGIGTLVFDLLTPEEQSVDAVRCQCNVHMLADRLVEATEWLSQTIEHLGQGERCSPRFGYFSVSRGGGAALLAATRLGSTVQAVVSRGGRPDLAGVALAKVSSPSLLIVAERDRAVLEMNRWAHDHMVCRKDLRVIAGATHSFEEPRAIEEVSRLSKNWFRRHLVATA